jgi:O-antigen ligase
VQFVAFGLLAALLPATHEYLPYLMGFWVVGAVVAIRKDLPVHFSKSLLVFLPALLFLFTFMSLLYSNDVGEGLGFMEKWLSVLFITVATLFLTKKVAANVHLFYRIFIVSNLLIALYCVTVAGVNSVRIDAAGSWHFDPSHYEGLTGYTFVELLLLRYSHFSSGFFSQVHHATYFSLYITFVLGILFYFLHKVKKRKWAFLYVFGILFFLVMNFLLASRAGYITTAVLIVFSFIWFFHSKVKRHYIIVGSVLLLLVAGFLLMKTRLGSNARQVVSLIFQKEVPKEKLDERLLLWNVGVDLVREAPLFGYGVGDVQDKLDEAYRNRGMHVATKKHFNVHNQYLSVALATGMVGLALLVVWFLGSLLVGIRTRNYLLTAFMLIVIINALFENILDRSAGLAFVLLFYPILMHPSLPKKRERLEREGKEM